MIFVQLVAAAVAAYHGRHEIAIEIMLASILFELFTLNMKADR